MPVNAQLSGKRIETRRNETVDVIVMSGVVNPTSFCLSLLVVPRDKFSGHPGIPRLLENCVEAISGRHLVPAFKDSS